MTKRIHKNWVIFLTFVVIMFLSFSVSKAETVKMFEIKAKKYIFEPNTIRVNRGDKVILNILSTDRAHGIGIKAFNIKSLLPKEKSVTIEFTADKKGEFPIVCTKFCGWKHSKMKGQLIVE